MLTFYLVTDILIKTSFLEFIYSLRVETFLVRIYFLRFGHPAKKEPLVTRSQEFN